MDESAFEAGPSFTEEGQLCDPEFVVNEEVESVDLQELDVTELMVNPEVMPLTGESFTVVPSEIDQELKVADCEMML